MKPLNIAELAELSRTDTESSPEFWADPVWVRVDHWDGTYDLYTVTGFESSTCQPTLSLKHEELVLPW